MLCVYAFCLQLTQYFPYSFRFKKKLGDRYNVPGGFGVAEMWKEVSKIHTEHENNRVVRCVFVPAICISFS